MQQLSTYNILQRFHPFKVGLALKSEKRCVFHPSNAPKRRQPEKALVTRQKFWVCDYVGFDHPSTEEGPRGCLLEEPSWQTGTWGRIWIYHRPIPMGLWSHRDHWLLCKKSCFAALSIWASEPATRASLIGNMEGKWLWREAMADRLLAQPRPCSKWSPARHLGECTFTRWDCQGDCRSYDSPHMDPGMRDSSRHDLQAKQPRWCGVTWPSKKLHFVGATLHSEHVQKRKSPHLVVTCWLLFVSFHWCYGKNCAQTFPTCCKSALGRRYRYSMIL